MSGDQLGGLVHRPCVRGQWLALEWIIQMFSKCQGSHRSFWSQSLGLRKAEFHLYRSFH